MHLFVHLPDFLWSLTLMLIKRSFFHVSNRCDVKEQIGLEADGLLVGHHLEEVEIPAVMAFVALPDQGTDDMVVRVGVERPMGHHNVGLHLCEPGGKPAPE